MATEPTSSERARDRAHRAWTRVRESGWLKWILPAGAVLFLILVAGWYSCGFRGCPDAESLLAYEPGGAPVILDRNGDRFATLLPVQREIVDIDSLPEHVGQAFIAVEDRRFRSHGGVDLRRVVGALVANIREGGLAEGGSTITMQLARNAFPDRLPASERTIRRKVAEARVAGEIEDEFGKDQILGLYLNQIYFGNGATGIAAAARHYFDASPSELRPEQAALLAAMVKAPAHYDPREDPEEALERRNLVLDLMQEAGFLSDEEHHAARETEIEVVPRQKAADAGETLPAPWFLEAIRRRLDEELGPDQYRTQIHVHTTLDSRLQQAAEAALDAQLRRIEGGELGSFSGGTYDPDEPPGSAGSAYLQGAVVVLGVEDGDVLALVGGRNYRHSTFDHALDGQRQVGSAFKPFVYGAAVAEGIPPSHRLDDTPISIELRGSPTYRPVNYDGEFRGPMTARDALRLSRNVPTVRLAQEIGQPSTSQLTIPPLGPRLIDRHHDNPVAQALDHAALELIRYGLAGAEIEAQLGSSLRAVGVLTSRPPGGAEG
ncbi:MAG: transglycosylase domain-containing protein, partial [Gemmatimonadetes bacterium]|nr:transglycosylase domain-containing protein [Gemmatimonadota bacterium]